MNAKIRILHLEDNARDSELMQLKLEAEGEFKILRVETEADYVRALEQEKFDLIIADYSLPSFDGVRGLELARKLRPEVPFLFFSAMLGEETAIDSLHKGATDYVLKQRPARLGPAVRRALQEAEAQRQRRRAEEALRESEERFRLITETIDEVFWIRDKDIEKIFYVSPGYERIWGRTREDLRQNARSFLDAIHPEDRPRVLAGFEVEKSEGSFDHEYRVVLPDGSVRWVRNRGFPVRDAAGQVGSYVGVAHDITQGKQAEAALRESEEKYRQIVELATEGIWAIDASNRTTFVNRQMATMLGYSVDEMMGKSLLDFMDAEVRIETLEDLERGRRRGAEQFERRFQKKDGVALWVHLSTAPMFGDDGQYTGVFAMVTDTTERRRLEEQFQQAQKMEAVGRLAGGVAHDFNNLLMVINGHSDLLLKKLDARDPMHEPVTEIRSAGQRATEVTQQLLAFSRKQIIQPRVLDLNRVVGDIEKMLQRLIGEDIALVTVLNPDLGRVMADPGQIGQVLMNLAVNSRDAMPNGGHLTIETANVDLDDRYAKEHSAVAPGPYVQLTVSDSGTGMDAETQAHLFEPFFTTKKAGEGTGLGLATVYGVVKQAGGFIWVYSEPGKGTAFKIYLPRVKEEVEVEEAPKPAGTPHGTETILLVEDQPELRKLARMILTSQGYKVLEAANGGEALFHSERHTGPIHLMLTDVIMPGMNGRELAQRLKPLRPEMKVLYMSGYTVSAIIHNGVLEAGIDYLQKPISPDDLVVKVREVLEPPRPAGTVLVVDDEAGIRSLVRGILQSAGYEVLNAENGKLAMREAGGRGVDLVITDVVMPEQEGIKTIQLLRKQRPNLKIIAMSGAAAGGLYLDMAKKLGAHATLAKPITPDELLATVRRILSEPS